MKKDIFLTAFHKLIQIKFIVFIGLIGLIGSMTSCVEDIVNYRTETKEMIGDYLVRDSAQFSEFNKMLDTTHVMGLLKAYGEYTCFAPTNEAVFAFYHAHGKTSMKDFPLDSIINPKDSITIKQIVYNQIIKGQIFTSDKFTYGRLAELSMNDRYISIDTAVVNGVTVLKVNKTASIIQKDIELNNGVIHEIDQVLNPSQLTSIEAIGQDTKFKLFYKALQLTRLTDKLLLTEDKTYNPDDYKALLKAKGITQGSGSIDELPSSKKYGYTLLMESDSTYAQLYKITTIDQLIAKAKEIYDPVYPEDKDVTSYEDPRNSFNRFVAYHLVNKQLSYSQFIKAYDSPHMLKNYDMYEYIETMCPNTLMEARIVRTDGVHDFELNMTNTIDDAVHIVKSYSDKDATNGVYHEIDKILAYNPDVKAHMENIRLRLDAASFFPELTNNNMRGYKGDIINQDVRSWIFPSGYIERLTCAEGTVFTYLNSFGGYLDYEGDEVYLAGNYDFSVVTPPIPAGTYEVRFGYQPTGGRGVAQLYFGDADKVVPCGIPLDLRVDADQPSIGYEVPGTTYDDPYGYENDKMMRNRGYMKGPCTYKDVLGWWYGKLIARNSNRVLRKILGIYTFDKPGTHVFKVKSVKDGQFMFDFLEFIPVGLIESEGVD
jgi:uncharacterized surface protein with fasciclin (FAS1) repeats